MAVDISDDLAVAADGGADLAEGDDALVIRLANRVGINQGEWPFDLNLGLPWLFQVLGRTLDTAGMRSLIAEKIGADPEVASVGTIEVEPLTSGRLSRVTASVKSVSGQTVSTG